MSADSPQVDWTNDEATLLAVHADMTCERFPLDTAYTAAVAPKTYRVFGGGLFLGHGLNKRNALASARQHPTVVAYEKANNPAVQSPSSEAEYSDTQRLNWLGENEAHLHTHRERLGDGYGIWWNVVKRNKSLSGHPLGSPRTAIDAAMNRAKARGSNG